VELAALAAGIHLCGKLHEEIRIEDAARETAIELFGIHAGQPRAQAGLHHRLRQFPRGPSPKRKKRCDAGTGELALAVAAYVLEEEVAEGDGADALGKCVLDEPAHAQLILGVAARMRQGHAPQRQARGPGLDFQKFLAHGVHGHAPEGFVHRREQPHDFQPDLLPQDMQAPGAVLAAAPGEEDACAHEQNSTLECLLLSRRRAVQKLANPLRLCAAVLALCLGLVAGPTRAEDKAEKAEKAQTTAEEQKVQTQENLIDAIAAQVGTEIVLLSEVLAVSAPLEKKLREAGGGSQEDLLALRGDVLDRLIERRLVDQVVRRAELEATDAEVDQAVAAIAKENELDSEELALTVEEKGMSFDTYRERIRGEIEHAKVLSAMVTSRVRVTEEEVRALFEEHYGDQARDGMELKLRHLLVSFGKESGRSEEEACALMETAFRRVQNGEAFHRVALDISEVNPEQGGNLGWIHEKKLASWMAPEVAKLEVGKTSGVIKTSFGCNLLQLADRRAYQPVEYSEVRERIHQELFDRKTEQEYNRWIDKLREQTYIEHKGVLAAGISSGASAATK